MSNRSLFATACSFLLLFANVASAAEDSLTTAVFSNTSTGYKRQKLPDGSFKPEYYAISNGGYSPGVARDDSIDKISFPAIAGVVGANLARENYFLAQDIKSADLLVVIQWGASIPFDDGVYRNGIDQLASAANLVSATKVSSSAARGPDGIPANGSFAAQAAQNEFEGQLLMMQMNDRMRDKANERNARLLGYRDEINSMADVRFAGGGTYYDDLISDIEDKRYYVIVTAYDFRATVKEKKPKFLWATRVSIQAQGNRFDERLVSMMTNASQHFGQDSGRLIRQFQRAPKVKLGELKFLGVVPESSTLKRQAPSAGAPAIPDAK